MKKLIKNNSFYRGPLMTFQHYLNTYHSVLPFEARTDGGSQLYRISSWYRDGILTKVLIERDEEFRKSPKHYLEKPAKKTKKN